MKLRVVVSPDADDLFMVRALLEGRLDRSSSLVGHYDVDVDTAPTNELNVRASGSDPPEVIAVSIGHYPAIAHRYQLLPHGGSLGEGYGPVIVGKTAATLQSLHGARLAIPGETTTAWLATRLLLGKAIAPVPVVVPIAPHERVFDALETGEVDFALLIHEGRLTYPARGLELVCDIGVAWAEQTHLPLPLGANVIRRDLGAAVIAEVSALLYASVADADQDRDGAIAWLLARGGPLGTPEAVATYLDMYANARTLDYGEAGRQAIRVLFERAVAAGLLAELPPLDFAI